jgi:dipeptidase
MMNSFLQKWGLFIFLFAGIICNLPAQENGQVYDQKLDCYSVVVGKDASVDGSVIIAHNEDTGLKLVNYYKVPSQEHPKGTQITLEKGGEIDQVKNTFGYLWINFPGINVCDSYMNEEGVVVTSDGCPSREDQPELVDGGIVYWLRRAIAERASTAREGVKIAGELIDKMGYASSGRTYIIGDDQEGWLVAAVNGKHWVAQRVPDNMVALVPNNFTIGAIDLSDTVNFMGSPDIIDYAVERGWYDPQNDGSFHFAKAYANPGSLTHPGNTHRWWRGVGLLSGQKYDLDGPFPTVFEPGEKVSVQKVMDVLRDSHAGTKLDNSGNATLGNPVLMNDFTICANGTQYSWVAQLRDDLPKEIASVWWFAPYRPDVQSYTPWYAGIPKVPDAYGYKDHEYAIAHQFDPPEEAFHRDNGHLFWDFVSLVSEVDSNYLTLGPLVQKEWKQMEEKAFAQQEKVENKFVRLQKRDPEKALEFITDYSFDRFWKVHRKVEKIVK